MKRLNLEMGTAQETIVKLVEGVVKEEGEEGIFESCAPCRTWGVRGGGVERNRGFRAARYVFHAWRVACLVVVARVQSHLKGGLRGRYARTLMS